VVYKPRPKAFLPQLYQIGKINQYHLSISIMNFNISPFVFQITETIGLRWYGLMYLAGLAITYFWMTRVSKYDKDKFYNFLFWGFLITILSARAGFVLFYEPSLLSDPIETIAIWHGGMSFHGGILGLIIFTALYCRYLKWSFLKFTDDLTIPAALFLFFGRIGNFLNNELWGVVVQSPESVPWCFHVEGLSSCRHPSQLYEALKNLSLFGILIYSTRLTQKRGVKSAIFLIGYGTLRSLIEAFWREPSWVWNGITAGQMLSIPLVIAGVILLIFSLRR
jgi:phosphatidylglycerol---prolipoprotein diacylglyceryl transferase